jgi:predicted enzyme related to lactoylglutathione lyase
MAGQLVHFELPAGDTARSREFWGSLFGWQFQSWDGPVEYHMTQLGEQMGGGIYPAEGEARGVRVYFDVDDINAGAARVRELGGESGEVAPVPGMGWYSVCKDTEGNEFGLWQSDPEAAAPSQ